MKKEIISNLIHNRLLKNNEEINTFEKNLELMAENFEEEDIIELCKVLDDATNEPEIMFGIIHLMETLSSEEAYKNTLIGVASMYASSPEWAKTILYRCLNDDYSVEMIGNILPAVDFETREKIHSILEQIKSEDEPLFGEAINKIVE